MTENNLEKLERQLFYTGFGEVSLAQLKQKVNSGEKDFSIRHEQEYGAERITAQLHFRKSAQGDYFFNSFDLELKKQGDAEMRKQNFRISYGNTFTLKEAYNLLSGRAVNKDFIKLDESGATAKKYNAWAELDLNEKDGYGNHPLKRTFRFDLEKELQKYPVKQMDMVREDLIGSLKKGNQQPVFFEKEGGLEKRYLEANPKFKTLNIYDENFKPVLLSEKRMQQQEHQAQNNPQERSRKAGPDKKAEQSKGMGL